ncbi:hypothetical protein [uncultured Arcobacter sp.]|uniref:hypothetical protein n=1 Tax=uncultured Arcobacter sp. TaxID=165434 RepID=UPI00262263BE|nr:hypothetical protein [uncultured Arcobacter sp.]
MTLDVYDDYQVIETLRSHERQMSLYSSGSNTKVKVSKHEANDQGLSEAVDIAPKDNMWDESPDMLMRYAVMFGRMDSIFNLMKEWNTGVTIPDNCYLRWGRDWDRDGEYNDQTFNDYPHVELIYKDK